MSMERVSQEVARVMKKYNEPDPWRLANAMGILIGYASMGTTEKSCKGFFLYQSRKMHITLNGDLSKPMQRIILAHEIGHAILHRDAAKMKAFHEFSLYDASDQYEYEANLFAAEYLLGDAIVADQLNEDPYFFSVAKTLKVPPELLDFKLRILKRKGWFVESPIVVRNDFLKDITERYEY